MSRVVKPRHKKFVEEDVWTLAVQRARRLFEEFDHVSVQFSGGKDSTAALHAVLAAAHEKPEERLPVRVVFWDEEAIPLETVEYVRRVSQRDDVALEWYCLPIKCGNACSTKSPFWYPWAPEDRDKWVRELPPEAITSIPEYEAALTDVSKRLTHYDLSPYLFDPAKHGESVQVLGIRAAESLRRHQAVTHREVDNWLIRLDGPNIRGAIWKAYPIYDWGNDDMWTAPRQFGWDYNRAYDLQEMHGIAVENQRMGPPFGNEPMRALSMWATCYPDVWDKMVYRVPGAATAARYSTTALYGFGEYPRKPEGITWMQFIMRLLDRHEAESRTHTAGRVRSLITTHRYRTDDLISETVPHPDSGVSWDYIAMVALRGDRMGRRDPSYRAATPTSAEGTKERKRAAYEEEIAKVRAEGRIKEII